MRRFTPAACLLALVFSLPSVAVPTAASAQSGDSVEGFMRRVFGPPEHERKKREPQKRSAEKPKGEARQKAEVKPETAKDAPAPTGAAAPVPLPSPDPRPEPDADAEKAKAAAEPARPDDAAAAAPAADAGKDAPTPVPGRPDALQPPPIESQPPEDIPVPAERPPEAPASTPAAEPAKPSAPPEAKPPVEGKAGVEPAKPDDAPNSTEKLKAREPTIDPATSVVAAAAVEDAQECETELKKRGVVFEVKPTISEGECGVLRPVSFERSSTGIKVSPGTQMLCRTALALDIWLTDSVAPAAKANFPDRKLTEFRQASTYVCRPRASESGISEHARGSAIDIGAFAFDKGPDIGIAAQAPDSPEAKFQAAVRAGACGPFKTVLGPGTDPDHATHFHLDIAARRNGSTYCK